MIKGEDISISCDVYSYGMVLFEILTLQLPFEDVGHYMVAGEVVKGVVRE